MDKFWSGKWMGLPQACMAFSASLFMRLRDSVTTILCRGNLFYLGDASMIQAGVSLRYPRNISIGNHTNVGRRVLFSSEMIDSFCHIGNAVIVGKNVRLDFSGGLSIGNDVVLSECVTILTHSHGLSPKSPPVKTPLIIEDNVWIGAGAIILEGVTRIGRGAVVAAGAVVTKEVTTNTMVGGVPARFIKEIDAQNSSEAEQ